MRSFLVLRALNFQLQIPAGTRTQEERIELNVVYY